LIRSPLVIIKEKEDEVATRIQSAQALADARLAEARARAAALHDAAEREGLCEAEESRQRSITVALEQAATIKAAGREEAMRLWRHGVARVPLAAQRIVEFILTIE